MGAKDLKDYNAKRNFKKTSEPYGQPDASSGLLKFFVHKHDASRLHYDLRLEFDGSLKSWAVPKGPTLSPLEQRLAVHVEDHPLSYGLFEGKIPEGQYGAGTIMLWDKGELLERKSRGREDSEANLLKGYQKGHITFFLYGEKLKGEFALVRIKQTQSWLLFKKRDQASDDRKDVLLQDQSVLSSMTIEELKGVREEDGRVWQSRPIEKVPEKIFQPKDQDVSQQDTGSRFRSLSEMMKPLQIQKNIILNHAEWLYYPQMSCTRLLVSTGAKTQMLSYTKRSLHRSFPDIFHVARAFCEKRCFEVEVHSFPSHKNEAQKWSLHITDLLSVGEEDLREQPFEVRWQRLLALKWPQGFDVKPMTEEQPKGPFFAKHKQGRYKKGVSTAFLKHTPSFSPLGDARGERSFVVLSEDPLPSVFEQEKFVEVRSAETCQIQGGPCMTHLQKEMWPEEGLCKEDVFQYYKSVAKILVPQLKNRPLSLLRFPHGLRGKSFFQKDMTGFTPSWLETIRIPSEKKGFINYPLCQNAMSLLYYVNLSCIDFNPWLSKVNHLEYPDQIYVDIDPDGHHFEQVVEVAQCVYEVLSQVGIQSFCKTSGSRGLHIMIPLQPKYNFEKARSLAQRVCLIVENRLPHLTSTQRSKVARRGRIYLDFMQNCHGQTLASVYSLRGVPGACVSAPLLWKEVSHKLRKEDFHMKNMLPRLERLGDLWANTHNHPHDVEECLQKLEPFL